MKTVNFKDIKDLLNQIKNTIDNENFTHILFKDDNNAIFLNWNDNINLIELCNYFPNDFVLTDVAIFSENGHNWLIDNNELRNYISYTYIIYNFRNMEFAEIEKLITAYLS